jgi:uncharacterized membrane protein
MDTEGERVSGETGNARAVRDYQPLDRFNAFSDGVFAIVITLLVLELPAPPAGVSLPEGLAEAWPDFLGYIISFAFVGGIWLSHAAFTKLTKRGDDVSFRLNLVLLLFVSLLPFTTKVMVTHMTGPDARLAVMAYGLNLLIASTLLTWLMSYGARDRDLVVDDVADDSLKRIARQRRSALILNAVGVVVAIVAPTVAVVLYIIVAVLFLINPLIGRAAKKLRPKPVSG